MDQPIRILIADDHALLRRGLATLLGFNKDIAVVGDAKNGEEAVKAAIKLKPDVVVMDLSMPVMDGVEATRQIREALPDTHVIILTSYSTSVDVSRAMDAGASGAFVKGGCRRDCVLSRNRGNDQERPASAGTHRTPAQDTGGYEQGSFERADSDPSWNLHIRGKSAS